MRNDFRHYQNEIGLNDAVTHAWGSPFAFEEQALLYVPPNMPEPNSSEYTQAVVQAALPVVKAAGGCSFLLFTSLRAMNEARDRLQQLFAEQNLTYPVLVQGDKPKAELLSRFRELGNAVLIGSHSFWEGVDVKGEALSVVVIDRLPFSPPDDPVVAARIETLKKVALTVKHYTSRWPKARAIAPIHPSIPRNCHCVCGLPLMAIDDSPA